jgi:hypothetical protein
VGSVTSGSPSLVGMLTLTFLRGKREEVERVCLSPARRWTYRESRAAHRDYTKWSVDPLRRDLTLMGTLGR